MDNRYFTFKLVEWYEQNHRKLPWRDTRDPYRIWLSEVILQQTRIAQGLPYYLKFVDRFPTVFDLATAKEIEVLRLWQGLGYYSRARNLHRCAREIAFNRKGAFPKSYKDLLELPGIGEYTAAAIASIAYDEPVAVVDGNVYRVLSRVFGVDQDISLPATRRNFLQLAMLLLKKDQPGLFNQAVMEFGALHCTPKTPKCSSCPFSAMCVAFTQELQAVLPVKKPRAKVKNRYFYYFVLGQGKRIGMRKRIEKDIWKNLYDFYLVEKPRASRVSKIIESDPVLYLIASSGAVIQESEVYYHMLSHQRIQAKFIHLELDQRPPSGNRIIRFYTRQKIQQLPKPALVARYLEEHNIL